MERMLIDNARIFDGSGAAPYAGHAIVEGSRISAVGRGPAPPVDAQRIDAAGATLIPGLIDGHTHLGFGSTTRQVIKPAHRRPEEDALVMAQAGRALLDSGYTSAYSGGSSAPAAELAVRQAFANGWLAGPRLSTCSFEMTPGGAFAPGVRFTGAGVRASAPDACVRFVEEMAAAGVDSVKFLLNGISAFDPGSNLGEQFHVGEIEAAAAAAHRLGVALTAHAYTPAAIGLAVRTGFRVLYHCNYADEAALDALEARKNDLFVGPAPGIVEADLTAGPGFGIMASPAQREEQAQLVERCKHVGRELRRRGIRVVPGGDYGFPWNPIGRNARDLTLFVEWFGYTAAEALVCATCTGGELMGLPGELGVLTPGALADLVLVDGDPALDIRCLENADNLRLIVKDGRIHKNTVVTR